MPETTISGAVVVQWLTRASQEDWSAIVGCLVDDGSSMNGWTILGVRRDLLTVTPEDAPGPERTRAWTWLSGGTLVLLGDRREVLGPVQRGRPAALVAQDEANQRLRQHGFDPERLASSDDVELLDRILEVWASQGIVPPDDDRSSMYLAVRRVSQDKAAVPVFWSWCDAMEHHTGGAYDLLGRLHLAVLLRHSGQPKQSLEVSSLVDARASYTASSQACVGMLCCHRAAAMLDLMEMDRDLTWLGKAERHLKRAWAIDQGDEVNEAYNRWRRIKKQTEAWSAPAAATLAPGRP